MPEPLEHLVGWQLNPEVTVTHRLSPSDSAAGQVLADAGLAGQVCITWEDTP